MIYISRGKEDMQVINLTRGDDAALTVALTGDDGAYEMGEGEYLIFGVREMPTEESELLLSLRSNNGSNIIRFAHGDTERMQIGMYSAEIQLMKEDGSRVTVWPKLTGGSRTSTANRKNFCLMTEVVR